MYFEVLRWSEYKVTCDYLRLAVIEIRFQPCSCVIWGGLYEVLNHYKKKLQIPLEPGAFGEREVINGFGGLGTCCSRSRHSRGRRAYHRCGSNPSLPRLCTQGGACHQQGKLGRRLSVG